MQKIAYHFVILIISSLLLVFYCTTVSNDFYEYNLIYRDIAAFESVKDAIINLRFEPGFIVLYFYSAKVLSAENLFLLIAIIVMLIKYLLFVKYLKKSTIAWIVYIIIFLPNLEASQLRTSIASLVILYIVLNPLCKSGYIYKAVLASMFHYCGLLILFLKFYKKPFFVVSAIIIGGLFIDQVLMQLSNQIFKLHIFTSSPNGDSVHLYSSLFITQCFMLFFWSFNWKIFNDQQKIGFLLIAIGAITYLVLMNNPGVAHRVREVSLLGIFPLLFLTNFRITTSSLLAYTGVAFICFYSLYYTVAEIISSSLQI